MKKSILYIAALALTTVTTLNSCIKEIDPQSSTVTKDQAANAPGAFNNFVSSLTSSLNGEFTYSGSSHYPWDFGYPSFFLQRDVMGQDIAVETSGSEWYTTWYSCGTGLGPTYAVCQLPWTYYYGWIKNCNTVLSLAGEDPANDQKAGAGIAYAMRAMFYMDLARMYAPETYAKNPEAATVPIITEQTSAADATNNPRATNKEIFALILSDLDKAETLLADYKRTDVYTPDVSVVYGLKARAYLTMEDWANAEKYAKQAQTGYQVMTKSQYLSKTDGFNKPNASWMFGLTFRPSDPNITENDADSSWGSQMIIEVSGSGCGYSANYVGPKRIDSHLFSTIPATDFRRMCFLDPALDEMSKADAIKAEHDCVIFLMGDMNCEEDTVPIRQLLDDGYIPCYKAATIFGDNNNGHHRCDAGGFSAESARKGPDRATGALDHFFIHNASKDVEVLVYYCIMDAYTLPLTDHYPNFADIKL